MLKDTLNSVFDNLKERTTNPFLGTLMVVWTLKNWKLVYSLFYFDSNLKLDDRLTKITEHFKDQPFLLNMVFVVLITLGVLITTYILLSLSRLITDAYDKIVLPYLSKLTDRSSVVLKSEHLALQEVLNKLEIRLEEERVAKVSAQQQRDLAEDTLAEVKAKSLSLGSNDSLEEDINDQEDRGIDFVRLANSIGNGIGSTGFNQVIDNVLTNEPIKKDNKDVRFLLRQGIIKHNDNYSWDSAYYTLTDLGMDFLKYWNQSIESQTA